MGVLVVARERVDSPRADELSCDWITPAEFPSALWRQAVSNLHLSICVLFMRALIESATDDGVSCVRLSYPCRVLPRTVLGRAREAT